MLQREQLYAYVENPPSYSDDVLNSLNGLVEGYPYYDLPKFIMLKLLYSHDTTAFQEKLNKYSVLITDREALFYFIFKEELAAFRISNNNKPLPKNQTQVLIDTFFDTFNKDKGGAFSDVLEHEQANKTQLVTTDYMGFLEEEEKRSKEQKKRPVFTSSSLISIETKEEVDPKLSEDVELKPVITEENKIEAKPSLIAVEVSKEEVKPMEEVKEDLPIIETKVQPDFPLVQEDYQLLAEDEELEELIPLKHQGLIDRFLDNVGDGGIALKLNKEDLKGDKDYSTDVDEDVSSENEDEYMTETLAKIFIKQGKYERAYKIIKELSLKYPRKNSYFAEQLDFLEKLIINSKYTKK